MGTTTGRRAATLFNAMSGCEAHVYGQRGRGRNTSACLVADLPTERRAAGRSRLPLRRDWRFGHADERMPMRPRLRTTPAHGPALRRSGRTRHVSSRTTDLPAERVLLAGQATWQVQLEFRHLTDDGAPLRAHPRTPHAHDPAAAATTPARHATPAAHMICIHTIHDRHTPSSPGQEYDSRQHA